MTIIGPYYPAISPYDFLENSDRERLNRAAQHAIIVCTKSYDPNTGYVSQSHQKIVSPYGPGTNAPVDAHAEILLGILLSVAAATKMCITLPYDSTRRADLICDFRRGIETLSVSFDLHDLFKRKIQHSLDTALSRWHFAFAHYIYEVGGAIRKKHDLTRLLILANNAMGTAAPAAKDALTEASEYLVALGAKLPVKPKAVPKNHPDYFVALNNANSTPFVASPIPGTANHAAAECSLLTPSQCAVNEYCRVLGELHFDQAQRPQRKGIQARFFPLIAAPTGAGKSELCRKLAADLGAEYLRVQRGDFVPQGARNLPTTFSIISMLIKSDSLILVHMDELDKWSFNGAQGPAQEWSAGIYSDLFCMLDGAWPMRGYLESEFYKKSADKEITVDWLQKQVFRIFIVGSGTWQQLFHGRQNARPLGFAANLQQRPAGLSAADIFASGQIAQELLARFHTEIQILNYPSASEIRDLLTASGIAEMALRNNYTITEQDLDFSRGGFRVLETLYTRLLVMETLHKHALGTSHRPSSVPRIVQQ